MEDVLAESGTQGAMAVMQATLSRLRGRRHSPEAPRGEEETWRGG